MILLFFGITSLRQSGGDVYSPPLLQFVKFGRQIDPVKLAMCLPHPYRIFILRTGTMLYCPCCCLGVSQNDPNGELCQTDHALSILLSPRITTDCRYIAYGDSVFLDRETTGFRTSPLRFSGNRTHAFGRIRFN